MAESLVVGVESWDGLIVVLRLDSERVEGVCVEFVVLDIEFVLFDFHADHGKGLFGERAKLIKVHIFPVQLLHFSA